MILDMNSHTQTQAPTQPHGAARTSGRVRKHSQRHRRNFNYCSSQTTSTNQHTCLPCTPEQTQTQKKTQTLTLTPTQHQHRHSNRHRNGLRNRHRRRHRHRNRPRRLHCKLARVTRAHVRTCSRTPAFTRAPARVHAYTHARASIDVRTSSGKRRCWRMAQHALHDAYAMTQTATIFADDNSTSSLRAEALQTSA